MEYYVSTCFYMSLSRIGGMQSDSDTSGRICLWMGEGAVGIPDHDSWWSHVGGNGLHQYLGHTIGTH